MLYSLQHFFDIVKSKKLQHSEFCVFMNKTDIFRLKLKQGISLSVCFGDKWNMFHDFITPKIPLIVCYIIRNNLKYEIPSDIIALLCKYITIKYVIDGNEMDEDEYFEHCYEKAIIFIHDEFIAKWGEIMPEQNLWIHVLNATDTITVHKIFWDISGIVIRSNLKRFGI